MGLDMVLLKSTFLERRKKLKNQSKYMCEPKIRPF